MSDTRFDNIDRLWDFGEPGESEGRFRSLLAEATLPEHAGAHAEILTQIARTQGLQRNFEEARATLDRVESMLTSDMTVTRIRMLLERGRVHNSSGDREGSRAYFLEALERARESGHEYYAVDAAHMMGIVTEPAEQLEWNLRAMRMAEEASAPEPKRWLGALYNNIGWTYHDLGKLGEALDTLRNALTWYEANGNDRQIRIGKWSVAKILRMTGEVDTALAEQRALAEEWAAAGNEDGYAFEELGECLLALGRGDEATSYFAQAYAVLSKDDWLRENEPKRLDRLKRLGAGPDESSDP